MMSPRPAADGSPSLRDTPLQVIHLIGNFLRIWSVYSTYWYLTDTGASVLLFIFSCLVPSSLIFFILQKPWKGRPLSNQQIVPSIINGAITALYFLLWGRSLKSCGPLRTIMAEYSGASLGVLSAVLYGRRGHLLKKVVGFAAMVVSFYLLSQGWATASRFPLTFSASGEGEEKAEGDLGFQTIMVPILAGILSAVRRVISRRVSLKNQLKKRLNAITVSSAACFFFPVAIWDALTAASPESDPKLPFWPSVSLSYILFGIILNFYVDCMAEERLHMVFSSARHLVVTGACVVAMEVAYKMNFSLLGFLVCALILGFGIDAATSVGRGKPSSQVIGVLEDDLHMPSLPT